MKKRESDSCKKKREIEGEPHVLTRSIQGSKGKDLILDVLSKTYPLTARKLFYNLKTQHNMGLSYQAVHLFLKDLVKEGKLIHKNHEYLINLAWVDDLINYCYNIKAEYSNVNVICDFIPKASLNHILRYKRKLIKKYAYLEKYFMPSVSLASLNEYKHREPSSETINFLEILNNESNNILLLGESGSGKSTLLKKMMYHYAQNSSLIPVFISLNNYYGEKLSVHIARRIDSDVSISMIEQLLNEGSFLILFDGLNEVYGTVQMDEGKVERKELTLSQIGTIMDTYSKNKFIISSRLYSDPKSEMMTYIVNPLNESDMEKYLISRGLASLYEEIKKFPRLRMICRNPLLLSTVLHKYESGSLEKIGKAKVYKFFINHLLLNWDSKFNQVDACTTNEVLKVLSRLGYATFENGTSITYDVLRPEINHKEAFAQIIFSSGLIKKVGNNYEFMYPCFQEYFASLELNYKIKNGLMNKEGLKELLKKEKWHEVVLLYAHFDSDISLVFNALYELFMEKDDRRYLVLAEQCLNSQAEPPKELLEKVIRVMGKVG